MSMNTRVKHLFLGAASIGVALMVAAAPAAAHDRRGHDGHRYHSGHYYGNGHHRHHRRHHQHRRHHYRHHHRNRGANRIYYNDVLRYPVRHSTVVYQQPSQVYYGSGSSAPSPNAGNLVGGALGGYLGSTIGKGSGRLAATVAGAVIGYSVGGHIGSQY